MTCYSGFILDPVHTHLCSQPTDGDKALILVHVICICFEFGGSHDWGPSWQNPIPRKGGPFDLAPKISCQSASTCPLKEHFSNQWQNNAQKAILVTHFTHL